MVAVPFTDGVGEKKGVQVSLGVLVGVMVEGVVEFFKGDTGALFWVEELMEGEQAARKANRNNAVPRRIGFLLNILALHIERFLPSGGG